MRFAFIAAKQAEHRVTILCRCMRVTRSGFYAWRRRGLSARARRDLVLRTKLRAFHAASRHRYGRPRLWKDLQEDGEAVVASVDTQKRQLIDTSKPAIN
jgi:putative transposase